MLIHLTEPCLALLIGPSGAGKSTFARRHFRSTEVLSSDFCRALVSDNEHDQSATNDAFELLHLILAKRLARRRTTVIDATNVQPLSRAALIQLARDGSLPVVAILFLLPEDVCQRRNQQRTYRQVASDIIREQTAILAATSDALDQEGFDCIWRLTTEVEADSAIVVRQTAV